MSMEDDLTAIRLENEKMIALRRGNSTLSAQSMRVEIAGTRAFRLQSDAARESRQAVFILAAKTADIALEDRFTLDEQVYRVVFVQPNKTAATIAEGVLVE